MHPHLLKLPFLDLTVKSYGTMMVVGFLAAVFIIRRLSRRITPDSQMITNAALYSLIAGVGGARLFYVIHYFDQFQGRFFSVFAIWQGGLELLGGVICAIIVIICYMRYHKLPVRQYLDILAIALLLALAFGRVGCFLNGCCYGKPTDSFMGVRFPYGSYPYMSQINPDISRGRFTARIDLPDDYFGFYTEDHVWSSGLKPYEQLTAEQSQLVDSGPYRPLKVHAAQLYSSLSALAVCLALYLFWRRSQDSFGKYPEKKFTAPGCTFGLMFILYGITRFFLEMFRDDNPFGAWGLTISQRLGIAMIVVGSLIMLLCQRYRPPIKE